MRNKALALQLREKTLSGVMTIFFKEYKDLTGKGLHPPCIYRLFLTCFFTLGNINSGFSFNCFLKKSKSIHLIFSVGSNQKYVSEHISQWQFRVISDSQISSPQLTVRKNAQVQIVSLNFLHTSWIWLTANCRLTLLSQCSLLLVSLRVWSAFIHPPFRAHSLDMLLGLMMIP